MGKDRLHQPFQVRLDIAAITAYMHTRQHRFLYAGLMQAVDLIGNVLNRATDLFAASDGDDAVAASDIGSHPES